MWLTGSQPDLTVVPVPLGSHSAPARPIALRLSTRTLVGIAAACSAAYLGSVVVTVLLAAPSAMALFGIPVGIAVWAHGVRGGALLGAVQGLALIAVLFAMDASHALGAALASISSNLLITTPGIAYLRRLVLAFDRRAREAEALAGAAGILAAAATTGETLSRILEGATHVAPARVGALAVAVEAGTALEIAAAIGDAPDCQGSRYPASTGITGRALRTREIQNVADVRQDPDYVERNDAISSALAVPILLRGDALGVIYLGDAEPGHFTRDDANVMRAFADHAAIAIDNERRRGEALAGSRALGAAEIDARAANELAAAAFKANPAGIVITRLTDGQVVDVNDALLAFAGKDRADVIGRTVVELGFITHETRAIILEQVAASGSIHDLEIEARSRHGQLTYLVISAEVLRIGEDELLLTAVHDITARRRSEDQLRHLALYDALTDLPNRTLFNDRLEHALRSAYRSESGLSVLLVDLDRFREVNDTLGHELGDQLLLQVARRVQSDLRSLDTFAHLGGNTFAVIVDGDVSGAVRVARKVLASFERPFMLDRLPTVISASVGVSVFPDHGADATTLLRRAGVALASAKQHPGGVAVYEPTKDLFSPERLGLTAELRTAIAEDQLVLHFQPVVGLASGEPESAEALVRWLHPARGLMPPGDFVPAAERTGMIKPLTEWVLAGAAAQAAEWARAGRPLPVSVNVSMRNLVDLGFADALSRVLAEHALDAGLLRLEITESAAMADPEATLEVLTRIRAQGVRIMIDDFGTGYSSLAHLRRLPVDTLKIDRAFVGAMRSDPRSRSIVRAATELAHGLGLTAIAEGVEDEATMDGLRELGCDFAQGYHVGRPMPAADFATWHARTTRPEQ